MTQTQVRSLAQFLWDRFDDDDHAARQVAAMDNLPGAHDRFERSMAEVASKRDILIEHPGVGGICRTCGVMTPETGRPWPCRTVRLLAFPYAHHNGYDEEWRP